MEPFNSSALALQKNLLNLRRERDRLRAQGDDQKAAELAEQIARIEAVIGNLPKTMKPPTLQ
ncbi:hypothetical protein P3R38_16305 [Pseudomonas sp. NyZ480]|uniref:hypothetical protein n=1 Tax=Pseudomonas sp. NyZ480 TaxID=3035289 RepID=UPI00240A4039|nr:hypothetical protein [Pseudomonas sp. NyZ480]WEZ87065.1 hypothetical protein P3R38_16305 [Pseudomonas sp. NyZ480]